MKAWIAYISAVVLVDLINIARYFRLQTPEAHKSFFSAVLDYYLGDKSSTITSATVFGMVWILGAVAIDHVGVDWLPALSGFPTHPAFSFGLGSLAEIFAPKLVKSITTRLFPGG